jgi:hypothetical protein
MIESIKKVRPEIEKKKKPVSHSTFSANKIITVVCEAEHKTLAFHLLNHQDLKFFPQMFTNLAIA